MSLSSLQRCLDMSDHRPTVGKLDSQSVKSIFLGSYSSQKGYKCNRRTFLSMDVTGVRAFLWRED